MLDGYEKSSFACTLRNGHESVHDVYLRGDGPAVVIMQELPGISPETLALCDRLNADGFSVVLPHLFGPLGKSATNSNMVRVLCMRREFHLFARNKSSPIVDWLRALCQSIRDERHLPGVAVIGMCLTGNFAISLMADDAVLASAALQPSLPILGGKHLHMSGEDIDVVKARLDEHGPMKAYRFKRDKISSGKKFDTIDRVFNSDRCRIETEELDGKGHSVLTIHFDPDTPGHPTQKAYAEVIAYFREKLSAAG